MTTALVRVRTYNEDITVTVECINTGDDLKRRLQDKFNDMISYTLLSSQVSEIKS